MKNLLIIFIIVIPVLVVGQSTKEKADKAFELLRYHEAIELYESHLENDKDEAALYNLSEAYFLTGKYIKTETALATLINEYNKSGEILLKYANVLIINNKNEEASLVLEKYIDKHPSTTEYKRLLGSMDLSKKNSNDDKYILEQVPFRSGKSDFCPQYYGQKLFYSSLAGGKNDPWTGKSFSNIYVVEKNGNEGELLKGNLNGKFHNGAVTFIDDHTMIFTRNNKKKSADQDYNLIIAMANKKGSQWNFEDKLPFNNKNFSNAYPTYLTGASVLIFSSDRPGGSGGMDLYSSQYKNGRWSDPKNLGKEINTSGDEVFSYYHYGTLYFSSNGRPGFGGLDVYSTEIDEKLNIKNIQPLPSPINSNKDDFGLITNDELKTGYFSTNRNSGEGIDEILKFTKRKERLSLSGIVVDKHTGIPLPNVVVKMKNKLTAEEHTFTTQENGRFNFDVIQDNNYIIDGIKNDIPTTLEPFSTIGKTKNDKLYVKLLHNDPRFTLNGTAHNTKTKEGVAGVTVKLYNLNTQEEKSTVTDDNGDFHFQLAQNTDYEISGVKDRYYTTISEATTQGLDRTTTLYVKLFLSIEEVIIGTTKIIGKEEIGGWHFDPIYYNLDKDFIREDASKVLDKIFDFLVTNPNLKIELGSHTDSRASDAYNMDLSNRRARSAMNYLIDKGINNTRITFKGYGETHLSNKCSNGIRCSEFMHQLNRRTEMKIIGK